MRRTQYQVPRSGWQGQAIECLRSTLPLSDCGRTMTCEVIARVLLWVSMTRSTGSSASRRLGLGVSDETVRKGVHASLPELDALPRLLRASLHGQLSQLRRHRRKRGYDIA